MNLGEDCATGEGGSREDEPSINETAARSPVQLEVLAVGAGDGSAGQSEGLVGSFSARELDEAVASVAVEVSIVR